MPFPACSSRLVLGAPLLALAMHAGAAYAVAVFPVGTGPGCGYATIQAAVDAAQAYPGDEDYIHISRSLAYTAQAIVIGNQTVELIGGFDTCQDNAPSGKTTISGAGGATEPVFRINGGTGSRITLRHLNITGGDEDSGGYGGGIYYRGNGGLEIIESNVSNNIAGYGGGIYAEGTGTAAELIIGSNVTIANNTARGSGGGIYVDSLEMAMTAPGSILAFNTAQGSIGGGYGGGLLVNSIDYAAYAYLGSTGQGALGLVYGNVAQFGGGVAVVSSNGDRDSQLELFSVDAAQPARIRDNQAFVAGGGLYTKPRSSSGYVLIQIWNAHVEDNLAPDGAAIYLDYDDGLLALTQGAWLFFNASTLPAGAAPCATGSPCGRIAGNAAVDHNYQPTSGSVIYGNSDTRLHLSRVAVEDNQGGRLIHLTGDESKWADFKDVLIDGNAVTQELIRLDGEYTGLTIEGTTVAGNEVGATQVVSLNGNASLERSIFWQPGKTVLQHSGGVRHVADVIGNEVASLGGGPQAIVAPPRFIDPARGDYGLRAASFAVDFAPEIAGDDRDMNGLPRDQDLPVKANFRGPRDIGALERQGLPPLVLNPDFNADLNLWPLATANSVSWDGSQNGSGGAGSGSAHVLLNDAPQARVIAASQCIHLPGPALYALNGWGRSIGAVGSRDTLLLHWEYRIDGGEACNAGPPTRQGDHVLTTSTAWTRPAVPAYIDVPDGQFTGTSSITIQLVVVDNSIQTVNDVNGWFDGIVLQPDSDVIFRNGFD